MIEDNVYQSNRVVAIHVCNDANEQIAHDSIVANQLFSQCKVVVFAPKSFKRDESLSDVSWIQFPDEADTDPKQKNFILKLFKEHNFTGFLHLVESCVKFNITTSSYMHKLESTMSALDYDIHLSTASDRCNYMFNKFCPRLTLNVDDILMKQILGLPDKLSFTSHSNVSYMTFNFKAFEGSDILLFNEQFTVGMFFIIDFLARRRALKKLGQLYYMNQYLSIGDEIGAYDIDKSCWNENASQETMQHENDIFRSLGVNYAPDNNIDIVLDALYNKIKEKMS